MDSDKCPKCQKNVLLKKAAKTALINDWLKEFHLDCSGCGEVYVFTYENGNFVVRNRDLLDSEEKES